MRLQILDGHLSYTENESVPPVFTSGFVHKRGQPGRGATVRNFTGTARRPSARREHFVNMRAGR
jgi:hypothetical protein